MLDASADPAVLRELFVVDADPDMLVPGQHSTPIVHCPLRLPACPLSVCQHSCRVPNAL